MFDTAQCMTRYGYENMDFEKVTRMLSEAYWSPGIGIDEVKKGASNSAPVIGVFHDNEQIGYALIISDKTKFAYILDVYAGERYRENGNYEQKTKMI